MRTSILFIAFVFAIATASSQSDPPYENNKSLLITYNGSEFLGFGGRFWLSQNIALNTIFNVKIYSQGSDGYTSENKSDVFGGELDFQYSLFHIDQSILYASVGFGIEGGSYKSSYSLPSGAGHNIQEDYKQYELLFGIGVEYFISKRLSVAGEHSLKYSIHISHDQNRTVKDVTNKQFLLGTSKILFSFYF